MTPGRRQARRRGMIVGAAVSKSRANNAAAQTPQEPMSTAQQGSTSADMTKQLTDLKGLLDQGILTQEEFDAKKKQILNL